MSTETQAALRRLLVDLDRPSSIEEWRYRGPRYGVVDRSDHDREQAPKAA